MRISKFIISLSLLFVTTSCNNLILNSYSDNSTTSSTYLIDENDYDSHYGTFYSFQELYIEDKLTENDIYNLYYYFNHYDILHPEEADTSKLIEKEELAQETKDKIIHDYHNTLITNISADNLSNMTFDYFGTYSGYVFCEIYIKKGKLSPDEDGKSPTEDYVTFDNYNFSGYEDLIVWKAKENLIDSESILPKSMHGQFTTLKDLYSNNILTDNDIYNIEYYIGDIEDSYYKKNYDTSKIKDLALLDDNTRQMMVDDYYLFVKNDGCKINLNYESVRITFYASTYNDYVICIPMAEHDKYDTPKISSVNIGDYWISLPTQNSIIYGWKLNS